MLVNYLLVVHIQSWKKFKHGKIVVGISALLTAVIKILTLTFPVGCTDIAAGW